MKLSLVIPCYNEEENLPQLSKKIDELIKNSFVQIILVDNGSSDGTRGYLNKYSKKNNTIKIVKINKNLGYGHGIIEGLKKADGDILSWTHADMQTDPLDVLKGYEIFKNYGLDIFVKGKRYGRPYTDIIFTVGMSVFETIFLKKFLWDINAQPTMFSKKNFQSWGNAPIDFSLDLYAYFNAKKNNIKVYKFPVKFDQRLYGVSKWNVNWTAKIKFIQRTLKYSFKLKKEL